MKKTVPAFVFAASILCAASPLYAKPAAHATAKPAATRVHTSLKSSAAKPARVTKAASRSTHSSRSSSTPYLQCVTFVRQFTGMQIFGDAWTWWEKATGKYPEGQAPKPGAVLVFRPQGKMKLGHVAVVSQIITDRYIQVTHANWSPINGRRGQVEDHVNVMDVSDKGDWSRVKVWYGPLNDFGTTVYTTYGFIYQDTPQHQAQAKELIQQDQQSLGAAPQQIAMSDTKAAPAPALPAELAAALTPGNDKGFLAAQNAGGKAATVSGQTTGASAKALVAKIDSDKTASK